MEAGTIGGLVFGVFGVLSATLYIGARMAVDGSLQLSFFVAFINLAVSARLRSQFMC